MVAVRVPLDARLLKVRRDGGPDRRFKIPLEARWIEAISRTAVSTMPGFGVREEFGLTFPLGLYERVHLLLRRDCQPRFGLIALALGIDAFFRLITAISLLACRLLD